MARFFFHLHECGDVTIDEEGSELPDLPAARAKAVDEARIVMCEEVKQGRLCVRCCIVIQDDQRREIDRVLFREAIAITGL